jgi:hypothetical protein
MIAFNKSFGTSYRGELLSVGYEKADARDGTSKLITLWDSSKIVDETEKEVQNRHLHHSLGLLTTWESNPLLPHRKFLRIQYLLTDLP